MKKSVVTLVTLIILTAGPTVQGQVDPKLQAEEKAKEAIKLMDNGKLDESIPLLQAAQQLDPERFEYPYEIAYALYLKKDYKRAIDTLEKYKQHPKVSSILFQLLGNSYDMDGKAEKALATYDEGLSRFPRSGNLFLEKGNIFSFREEFDKALENYEGGIEADPRYPSNYYRAARLYCNSSQEVWGMIYGEIFMNLERNSQRTAEISKLLYDTYVSEIKVKGDSASVSFCNAVINGDDLLNGGKLKIPFCMVYEQTYIFSVIGIQTVDQASLSRIRQNFVGNYRTMGHNKTHPNVLFDYQEKILNAGHAEAYNRWILMKGDEDGFEQWRKAHETEWDAFIQWFRSNGLVLNNENKFYRKQY